MNPERIMERRQGCRTIAESWSMAVEEYRRRGLDDYQIAELREAFEAGAVSVVAGLLHAHETGGKRGFASLFKSLRFEALILGSMYRAK